MTSSEFTHLDEHGAARMVDVSGKQATVRVAVARGRFETTPDVIALLRKGEVAKGDAIAVARVAGIMGAKRTPDLIPLCHPVALHSVDVAFSFTDSSVQIEVTTRTADRTGIEMEAMTAVAAAGLTLYDMVKAVDRSARLTDMELVRKEGGKSGLWQRA